MKKPSVMLRHDDAYVVAGILLVFTALLAVLIFFQPTSGEEKRIAFVIVVSSVLLAVAFFYRARSWEALDETGIHVKTPFYERKYLWSDVKKVRIVTATNTKGGRYPMLSLQIVNRKSKLNLDYTKKTMACISCYYGTPDEDKWGEPPGLL